MIEVPYSICVVQVGLVQQDGSTEWIGTGVTGAPISKCQNTTEYFTDVIGGTVAFHQFILNGTSFKIVAIQPPNHLGGARHHQWMMICAVPFVFLSVVRIPRFLVCVFTVVYGGYSEVGLNCWIHPGLVELGDMFFKVVL